MMEVECDGCGTETDIFELEVTESGKMLCYQCASEQDGEYEDLEWDR